VSYDFTMLRRAEARREGADPRWRMNNTAMGLILALLDQRGILDWEEPGPSQPRAPVSCDWEDENQAIDAALTRWHAEQRGRVERADVESLKVPSVKFQSNASWEVFPAEAARIAQALRETTEQEARAAIARDEQELGAEGISTDWGETPVEDVLQVATEFADFCERAARHGGFRVS
jgi:hypothetical protein